MLIDVILQAEDFKLLEKEQVNGLFPKALLLCGKDKLYLHEFAKAVSMLILDGRVDTESVNAKKVMLDAHPDIKNYPLKDKLLVSDSEEIVEESFIKPIFADKKIFVIHNIDNSMDSAQNKLLKVVEEPSHNVYMILTCTNPSLVLPTIRSRCNKVQLKRLSDESATSLLSKMDEGMKELVLAVADGQIGKAQALSKMKDFEGLCQDCLSVFTKMKSSKQVLTFSKKLFTYKEQFSLILDIFSLIVEDLLKIKSGHRNLVRLIPFVEELVGTNGDYTIRALCEIASLLDKVAREKMYNVNMTLAIENLLLNILEVKYICR